MRLVFDDLLQLLEQLGLKDFFSQIFGKKKDYGVILFSCMDWHEVLLTVLVY